MAVAMLGSRRARRRGRTGGRSVWRAAEGGDEIDVRSQYLGTLDRGRASTGVSTGAQLLREHKVSHVHPTGPRAQTRSY
jgi:hypothetical protein